MRLRSSLSTGPFHRCGIHNGGSAWGKADHRCARGWANRNIPLRLVLVKGSSPFAVGLVTLSVESPLPDSPSNPDLWQCYSCSNAARSWFAAFLREGGNGCSVGTDEVRRWEPIHAEGLTERPLRIIDGNPHRRQIAFLQELLRRGTRLHPDGCRDGYDRDLGEVLGDLRDHRHLLLAVRAPGGPHRDDRQVFRDSRPRRSCLRRGAVRRTPALPAPPRGPRCRDRRKPSAFR